MKLKRLPLVCTFLSVVLTAVPQEYTNGVFILNEDWFGHNNSSLNFLNPASGQFDYEIVRNNDRNAEQKLSLGCTAQFGTVYGDRMYIMSKQDQDPGESGAVRGGRLVVADARTMEIIKSFPAIYEINGKSAADGRGFVGVNEQKGYVGTSNGIFVLDLDNLGIGQRIAGTENPLITGGESNADGLGSLYRNQIGMMLRTQDYVLAIQQDKGILVIDPETDTVQEVIEGCFSTMAQSKDGTVWVGRNSNMDYQTYPYGNVGSSGEEWEGNQLLKLNPATLAYEIVEMPYAAGINQTWYAWTAGSLCASTRQNRLYFTFNADRWSWFTCATMFMYDIDENTFYQIYDSNRENRYFYGASIRINPLDDKLYAALYIDNINQSYFIYQLDNEGNRLKVFEPIKRYWFPAMFIFPDAHAPVVDDFAPVSIGSGQTLTIDLGTMATDADNSVAAITKRVVANSNETGLTASVRNNTLTLKAGQSPAGQITVRFNSNGKTVDKILTVAQGTPTSVPAPNPASITVTAQHGTIRVSGLQTETRVQVFNLYGQLVRSQTMKGSGSIAGLPAGQIYLIKAGDKTFKTTLQP
ncbi:MAG: DUF5074 domain-containing protein [Breznakibacter sp.]